MSRRSGNTTSLRRTARGTRSPSSRETLTVTSNPSTETTTARRGGSSSIINSPGESLGTLIADVALKTY
jgi:hypothetical protein